MHSVHHVGSPPWHLRLLQGKAPPCLYEPEYYVSPTGSGSRVARLMGAGGSHLRTPH